VPCSSRTLRVIDERLPGIAQAAARRKLWTFSLSLSEGQGMLRLAGHFGCR